MGMARAVTAAAAILVALAAGCSDKPEKAPPKPSDEKTVLFRFDRFKSAAILDGGELALDSLAGKVVLVDLFGTWSPACRRSAPLIVSLCNRFPPQDMAVLGLAMEKTADPAHAADAVRRFGEEFGLPYPLALVTDVLRQELREKMGADPEVPTVLLLDRQQIVRYVFRRPKPGEEAVISDCIERLLAEPVASAPRGE
jgi:thiol-disulfide isomerase/thioredoxin